MSTTDLPSLYRQMLRIRLVEEKIAELYQEQQMRCPVHLSIGQEAVAAAAGAAVTQRDYAMSGHRSHAHYLAKGGSLKKMMAELYGKATGCCQGKGGSMHLIDLEAGFLGAVPIVGSTIPICVGTALASKMKKEDRVSLTFLGEGSTEEGVFHESINFASLKKLPVVFVCENNFFSVYSPLNVRQPGNRQVFEQAIGHGVPAFQGDGNNVMEVYRMVSEAVARARAGEGPTFLEFITYRWREHCGPGYDNDIGYRTVEEFEEWKKKCPLVAAEKLLKPDQLPSTAELKALHDEIEEAVAFAKASPFPEPSAMFENLYA